MHHVGPGREIAASYRNAGDGPCLFFSVGRTGMYVAVFLGDVSLVRAFRYVGPFLLRAATVSRQQGGFVVPLQCFSFVAGFLNNDSSLKEHQHQYTAITFQ